MASDEMIGTMTALSKELTNADALVDLSGPQTRRKASA